MWLGFYFELAGHLKQLRQQASHGDVVGIAPQDRLADCPQGLRKQIDVLSGRDIAGLEVDIRNALVVSLYEPPQNLGEEPAIFHAQSAHYAKIDGNEIVVCIDKQIPLMHVGMKETVTHRMPQE